MTIVGEWMRNVRDGGVERARKREREREKNEKRAKKKGGGVQREKRSSARALPSLLPSSLCSPLSSRV
jgi:hypothetical protein